MKKRGGINKVQISLKIDADLNRFMRARAAERGESQATVVQEGIFYLQTRLRIEDSIRSSIYRNRQEYRTLADFSAAMVDPDRPPRSWKVPLTLTDDEEFIRRETFNALAEWDKRAYDLDWLKRAVLDAEYYVPHASAQETLPLPFMDTPSAQAPEAPIQKKPRKVRNEATV